MAPQSSASSPATRLWFPWAQELLAALASLHFFPGLTQRHLGCLSDAPCPSAVLPRLCSWRPPRGDCRRPLRAVRLCPCPDPCGAQGRAVRDDSKTDCRLRRSTPGGPAGQSSIPGDSGVGSVGHTHWHLSSNVASPGRAGPRWHRRMPAAPVTWGKGAALLTRPCLPHQGPESPRSSVNPLPTPPGLCFWLRIWDSDPGADSGTTLCRPWWVS